MYTTLFSAALFSVAALQGVRAAEEYTSEFAVNQPDLVAGSNAKISWQPTQGPYNILIVPENDPCNEVLADLGDHDTTFFDWENINLTPGTRVLISIEDKDGKEGWSKAIEVKPAAVSSVSSSVAPSSSQAGSSTVVDGTTLVVAPTGGSTTASASPSSSSAAASVVAVGAAGNGIINSGSSPKKNGALSAAAVSIPALALTALGAVLVL